MPFQIGWRTCESSLLTRRLTQITLRLNAWTREGRTLLVGIRSETTLEAKAMRSIVQRHRGKGYGEFLRQLAVESGIATPKRQ